MMRSLVVPRNANIWHEVAAECRRPIFHACHIFDRRPMAESACAVTSDRVKLSRTFARKMSLTGPFSLEIKHNGAPM